MSDAPIDKSGWVRPFYCGTQAWDWGEANCDRCTKSEQYGCAGESPCEIERAIQTAEWSDGLIPPDIARRMNADEKLMRSCWKCGEWEPAEEWKAEVARLRAAGKWHD